VKLPGATHLVVGFESRAEAERFLKEFRERLAKFGLELHAEKTRLIEFGRYAAPNREKRGEGTPETFTFLGFTHYCGKRRKDGAFIVRRETFRGLVYGLMQDWWMRGNFESIWKLDHNLIIRRLASQPLQPVFDR
jgi:hypothetical protein